MIDVNYLLTTSSGLLEHIAEQLGRGYGAPVHIGHKGLIFPPGLAEGRFEYYNLEPDLSMTLIDCTFFEEIRFQRLPIMINHFQALSFNLSTISFLVEKHDSSSEHIGTAWKRKVLYSSSEKGLGWTAPKDGHIRMLVLYFTRSWLQRYYNIAILPGHLPYAQDLMQDKPIQFSLDLDLELLLLLQEILATPAPQYMADLYYEGCAKKLIANIARRVIMPSVYEPSLNYQEVIQILNTVQSLELQPDQALPLLEDLAQSCLMSKSKFEKMFKAIYGKSLTDHFLGIRMRQAASLLLEGCPAPVVAQKIGYSNTSHFARVFKSYYKTTPKAYKNDPSRH